MDFSLSEEQQMLAASARSLAENLFGAGVARQALNDDRTAADKGWSELHASGLTTLLIPDELGGGGGTLLDACVVLSELSAALAPVPYLTSAVAAPLLLRSCAQDDSAALTAALCAGETYGVVVDDQLRWPRLTGGLVCLDWQPGRTGLLVDGGHVQALDNFASVPSIDPLHPVGVAPDDPKLTTADGPLTEADRRALAGVRVAAASALTGTLAGAATLAWDYIKTREQYGRPIASFQVIRHMAADLLVDLETCRSVSYGAAWQVDNESVETAIQLLGGIGVTWESTAHLYLRNAHLLSSVFGDTRSLLRQVGREFIEARGGGNDGPA